MIPTNTPPTEDPVRPHSYDGIQEYDKRLPNWWLFTLYASIAFSIVYWFYYQMSGVGADAHAVFAREMEAVAATRLTNAMGALDEDQFWEMSRNPKVVAAGREVYTTNCVACHLTSLRGKDESPAAIGPNLVDAEWVHGGRPADVRRTVEHGVVEKGMLAWGPILGDRKVVEVVAYILSHHEPSPGMSSAP
jgi:cytochrome c oxidase cbb3-type subunit 3